MALKSSTPPTSTITTSWQQNEMSPVKNRHNHHHHHNHNHNNNNGFNKSSQSTDDGVVSNGVVSGGVGVVDENQVVAIRNSLLSPNEVTFCDVSDDDSSIDTTLTARGRRKRPSSSDTDADSIMSSASKTTRAKPEIPDGGFGWVVVFASLVVSLIADGISFSFGLLYTEFLVYFGESKSKTAWIGSIFLAVPLLSGPVMSNLVDKYGCRRMTIIGGVMSGVGFMLAAISNSVEMLYWTFGFAGGLGLGIGYVTAVCSVVGWFDKKRTFATGIGASGTGIGTFLYAPFTQYLIETFGWRGTCLILAGTLFNICVCGSLMRDPDWMIEANRLESRSQSMQTFSNSSVCLDEIKKLLEDGAPKEIILDTLVTNCNTEANQQISDPNAINTAKKYSSLLQLPTYLCSPLSEFDPSAGNGFNYGSRRSLRKKNEDEQKIREELLAMSLLEKHTVAPVDSNITSSAAVNATTTTSTTVAPNHLASLETLNASEKFSFYDDDRLMSRSVYEVNFINEKPPKTWSNERLEYSSSRLSLQDTKPTDEDEEEQQRRNMRGNSVDAVYDPNLGQLLQRSTNDVTIMIPTQEELMHRSVSQKRRQFSQFRRNTTLRNSNYLRNMRIHRNSIHYRGALLNTHRYRLRASSCPNIYRNSMTTLAREDEEKWYDSFMDVIKSIFDFSLFLNPKFVFFEISSLLLFIWFIVPYFYLPEHMLSHGYNEDDSAFLISVIGVFQTIGMIGLGYLGDSPWLNVRVPQAYACCLILCGISTALMPLVVTNYAMLFGVCVVFGITFASSFSFTPIILVQLVSLDDFTCAYGLVLLIQGVGNLVGPPLAGFMYELTGVWDSAFYTGGFFIAVAGLFVYVTGYLQNRDRENEKADSVDTDE